jgi:hypothetical protein
MRNERSRFGRRLIFLAAGSVAMAIAAAPSAAEAQTYLNTSESGGGSATANGVEFGFGFPIRNPDTTISQVSTFTGVNNGASAGDSLLGAGATNSYSLSSDILGAGISVGAFSNNQGLVNAGSVDCIGAANVTATFQVANTGMYQITPFGPTNPGGSQELNQVRCAMTVTGVNSSNATVLSLNFGRGFGWGTPSNDFQLSTGVTYTIDISGSATSAPFIGTPPVPFGETLSVSVISLPEPGSMSMLAMAGGLALRRKRRRPAGHYPDSGAVQNAIRNGAT